MNVRRRVVAAVAVTAACGAVIPFANGGAASTPTTTVVASASSTTVVASASSTTVVASASSTTVVASATSTTTVAPAGMIDSAAIRAAKVGWARFVAGNFARPTGIAVPCPNGPAEELAGAVGAVGLTASTLPLGVWLYRDAVGTGIVGIGCGVDFTKSPTPAGATNFALEVTVLDGVAEYPQYVTRVAGPNTPIDAQAELGGDSFKRCRNEPLVCVGSWHNKGLVITVRLEGPRTADSETQAATVVAAVVPFVVSALATIAPPP